MKENVTGNYVIGFVAALVLGVGGGFASRVLSAEFSTPSTGLAMVGDVAPSRARSVRVERMRGHVEVLAGGGNWRMAHENEVLTRPTAFMVKGTIANANASTDLAKDAMALVEASALGLRWIADQGARVLVSAPEGPLVFQLDRGRVLVKSDGREAVVYVPLLGVNLSGLSYGAWLDGDALHVAVLEGSLNLALRDGRTVSHGTGQEVVVRESGIVSGVLPERLEVQVLKSTRLGRGRFRVRGQTWPHAIVRQAGQPIALSADGSFEIDTNQEAPTPGALVAFDAAGRWAEIGRPSERLGEGLWGDKASARPKSMTTVSKNGAGAAPGREIGLAVTSKAEAEAEAEAEAAKAEAAKAEAAKAEAAKAEAAKAEAAKAEAAKAEAAKAEAAKAEAAKAEAAKADAVPVPSAGRLRDRSRRPSAEARSPSAGASSDAAPSELSEAREGAPPSEPSGSSKTEKAKADKADKADKAGEIDDPPTEGAGEGRRGAEAEKSPPPTGSGDSKGKADDDRDEDDADDEGAGNEELDLDQL